MYRIPASAALSFAFLLGIMLFAPGVLESGPCETICLSDECEEITPLPCTDCDGGWI